jgi:hypothetical protein
MFGFLQGYFSLPQGYPYQLGGYVFYPAPYIPPQPPMYSYPEACCCFGYGIEPVFSEITYQEVSGDRHTIPTTAAQMTSTTNHPTTSTTTRTETSRGISKKKNSKFLQKTTVQSTTELTIEPKTVSTYQTPAELSTTTSESTKQPKTELSTQSIAEINTEPIIQSSKIAPEETESTAESTEPGTVTAYVFTTKLTEPKQQSNTEPTIKSTESATESAKLITEATAESMIKITEYTQGSTTESTTNAQHTPETTNGSTAKSNESTARPTDKSTKEAAESTTQTTVDFKTETPIATTLSTIVSMPNEENQYTTEEGITTSTIRTTEESAESTVDNYQHLSTASNSYLTTEKNKLSKSGLTTHIISDKIYDEISESEDDPFPYIEAA